MSPGARLLYILDEADLSLYMLVSGVLLLAFGLVLLSPAHTFSSSVSYGRLAALAPEWLWGLAFAGSGVFKIASLLHYTNGHRRPLVWRVNSVLVLMAWMVIATSFLASNPASTGGWLYLVCAAFQFNVVRRLVFA